MFNSQKVPQDRIREQLQRAGSPHHAALNAQHSLTRYMRERRSQQHRQQILRDNSHQERRRESPQTLSESLLSGMTSNNGQGMTNNNVQGMTSNNGQGMSNNENSFMGNTGSQKGGPKVGCQREREKERERDKIRSRSRQLNEKINCMLGEIEKKKGPAPRRGNKTRNNKSHWREPENIGKRGHAEKGSKINYQKQNRGQRQVPTFLSDQWAELCPREHMVWGQQIHNSNTGRRKISGPLASQNSRSNGNSDSGVCEPQPASRGVGAQGYDRQKFLESQLMSSQNHTASQMQLGDQNAQLELQAASGSDDAEDEDEGLPSNSDIFIRKLSIAKKKSGRGDPHKPTKLGGGKETQVKDKGSAQESEAVSKAGEEEREQEREQERKQEKKREEEQEQKRQQIRNGMVKGTRKKPSSKRTSLCSTPYQEEPKRGESWEMGSRVGVEKTDKPLLTISNYIHDNTEGREHHCCNRVVLDEIRELKDIVISSMLQRRPNNIVVPNRP